MRDAGEPLIAALVGGLIGAGTLGAIGSHAETLGGLSEAHLAGVTVGFVLGSIVGWGAVTGGIHRVTVGVIFGALVLGALGPGFDDPGLGGALSGALIGAALGGVDWWLLLVVVGGVVGAAAGVLVAEMMGASEMLWPFLFLAGLVLGAGVGYGVGMVRERRRTTTVRA